jgi:HEPN/Toprim N-terminal domain 1
MGSFSYLTVADYPIFDAKNDSIHEIVNLLFQPDDYLQETRPFSSKNKIYWGDAYSKEERNFTFKGFKQSVKVCKQRLEIYGYSLKYAKEDFKTAKRFANREYHYDFPITQITFKQYIEDTNFILTNKIKNYQGNRHNLREGLITDDLYFLGQSIAANLYSIFTLLKDSDIVEYDLSDIIDDDFVDYDVAKQIVFQKIIILTEGKTDVEFISNSIKLLYPHLLPYYHFINFDEYKVESNASALVKLVVSFAAANIKHPIIVLFDNDTTGIMEMNALLSKQVPSNIKVLKLPDIKLAMKYLTIGPTGIKKMNVNGLACGIEMYLGQDTLKVSDELSPVQWKSYNEKENKYLGEIANKGLIQTKFREKLKTLASPIIQKWNYY